LKVKNVGLKGAHIVLNKAYKGIVCNHNFLTLKLKVMHCWLSCVLFMRVLDVCQNNFICVSERIFTLDQFGEEYLQKIKLLIPPLT